MTSNRKSTGPEIKARNPAKRKFIPSAISWDEGAYQKTIEELNLHDAVNAPSQALQNGNAPSQALNNENAPSQALNNENAPSQALSDSLSNPLSSQPCALALTTERTALLYSRIKENRQRDAIVNLVETTAKEVDGEIEEEGYGSDYSTVRHEYRVTPLKGPSPIGKHYYQKCLEVCDISMLPPLLKPVQDIEVPISYEMDISVYTRTKYAYRLLIAVDELEGQCASVISIFDWEKVRTTFRDEKYIGKKRKLTKAPCARTFLKQIVYYLMYLGKTMKSAELQRIDEAVYIVSNGIDNYVFTPPVPQTTGRAVEASGSLDPTKSEVEFFNPVFMFKNLLYDQLKAVADSLKIPCQNKKIAVIDSLTREWIHGNATRRKQIFDAVNYIVQFFKITAHVTPHQVLVCTQVLHRVKNGNGRVSDHLTFKVLMTTLRPSFDVFLLCAAIPPGRIKIVAEVNDDDPSQQQLSDVLPKEAPIMGKNLHVNYPKDFKLYINDRLVPAVFDEVKGTQMPLTITTYCKSASWNTFHMTFDLNGQNDLWIGGLIAKLVYGKIKLRGDKIKTSIC